MSHKNNEKLFLEFPILWAALGTVFVGLAITTQLTHEMKWGIGDFVAAAVLLLAAGAAVELPARLIGSRRMRIGVTGLLIVAVMLIWADGAVGVF